MAIAVAAYSRLDRRGHPVIAVLPVRDPDADSTQPYLADAITDQLIVELGRSPALRVINRRTMMTFRESTQGISAIAHVLNADAVLQSTIRRVGDSVHLTVELSRSADETRRWKHTFLASGRDIPALSAKAADSVAGQTLAASAMVRAASSPRPVDSAAFNFYIRGRYSWNKRGPGLQRSIGLFNDALDQDPTFAPAYAGMADAYVQLGYASLLRPDDAFPKARAAARRASELDASLAEPHATLGFVALYYEWDWPTAEREFRRALAVNPGYATAHEWYGLYLAAMGRFDEARAQEDAAQALDPLSTAVAGTAAWVEYYAGQNARAERGIRIALRTDSMNGLSHFYLGRVLQATGSLDRAWLDRGVAERTHWMVWLRRDPRWEKVRRDPRFVALAERLRLPP